MSDDPVLAGFTMFFVVSVAMWPMAAYFSVARRLFGPEAKDVPAGCVVVGLLLFVAAIPLGYWAFRTFEIVWRT